MDTYQQEALRQLGLSLQSAGEIVATVSRWPESERQAKEAHIYGALYNSVKARSAANQVMSICA